MKRVHSSFILHLSNTMSRSSQTTFALGVLVFGILCTSMVAILVRWANAPAAVIGFWRMLFASIALAAPFGMNVRRELPTSRPVLITFVAGLFFAINLVIWNTGALLTSAANATLLGNMSVVIVPLGAMMVFRQKLHGAFWIGVALTIIGVVLILGQDLIAHPTVGLGDVLTLVSAFFYSTYLLIMERARAALSALAAWWLSTFAGTICLFVASFLLSQSLTGYAWTTYLIFGAMAIFVQIGGYLSLSYAQGHLPAPLVSTTLFAQPVLAALIAVPLLGQSLALEQILGGIIVLTGIFLAHRSQF